MKERIDHSNYEAWLLDRLEGNLTPDLEVMLNAFLIAHPELDVPLDDLPTLDGAVTRLAAADKEALKRMLPPTGMPSESLDEHLVARLEGDLSAEQEEALRQYLHSHPEHQRAERIYANTKLLPEAMAFAARKELKRDLPPTGTLDANTLDDHLVARLEGDLAPAQEAVLARFLANDTDAYRQWSLMQLTRIPADTVVFPAKDGLKKGAKVIAIGATRAAWMLRLRVAASVAVLLGIALWALLRSPGSDAGDTLVEQPRQEVEVPEIPVQVEDTPDPDEERTPEDARREELPPAQQQALDQRTPVPTPAQEHSTTLAQGEEDERQTPGALDILPVRPFEDGTIAHVPRPLEVDEDTSSVPLLAVEEAPVAASTNDGIPVGAFLAGVVRKQVLDDDSDRARPLDGTDAVAAVDKGLRVVAGSNAGLAMERTSSGSVGRFDLRLGRNLSISARR